MTGQPGHLLLVDDNPDLLQAYGPFLRQSGYQVSTAPGGEEALFWLEREPCDLVVSELRLPGMSGVEFLRAYRQLDHGGPVLVLTDVAAVDSVVEALQAGACGYLQKPLAPDQLLAEIERYLVGHPGEVNELIGRHESLLPVRRAIQEAASVPVPVLITGESGTGKQLVAQQIHSRSPRAKEPFVHCYIAALAPGLVESELFGHVKGAFSGATGEHKGWIEAADGGTLFLDEIGDLELPVQVRLLHVLQEYEIYRVGSTKGRQVDVRFISATHRHLEEEIQAGRFRQDLFFRLHILSIHLPPLRKRCRDIPLLCRHYLQLLATRLGKSIQRLTPEAAMLLERYDWPGNVRELEHVLTAALIRCGSGSIDVDSLPDKVRKNDPQTVPCQEESLYEVPHWNFQAAQRCFEALFIERVLQRTRGNISQAAGIMGLSRRHLHEKIKKHRIDRRRFANEESILKAG